MTWLARFLAFFLAFTLEVQVQATQALSLPRQNHPIQQPENCLSKSETCAIRTEPGYKFSLKVGSSQVVIGGNTVVVRTSNNRIELLQGTLWIKPQGVFTTECEFGHAQGSGEYWAFRRSDRFLIRATGGDVVLYPRGGHEALAVHRGQENWLGPVTTAGVSSSGIPQPISFNEQLRNLASLFSGNKADFKARVHDLYSLWRRQVDEVAQLQRQLATRELASVEEQHRKQVERRKHEAQERAYLRALFRRKNNLDL